MTLLFINFSWIDLVDIGLVSILMYFLYQAIKNTVAMKVLVAIGIIYLLWFIVKAFKMELLGSVLQQIISVGVVGLIIIFQQELRRFLIILGSPDRNFSNFINIFKKHIPTDDKHAEAIIRACERMSREKIGALVVVQKDHDLTNYVNSGEFIDAEVSKNLIISIFYKNNPTHDGALIVVENRIKALRCILPLTAKKLPKSSLGLRHRAAIGISEISDCVAIIVSEQTGTISYASNGELHSNPSTEELKRILTQ